MEVGISGMPLLGRDFEDEDRWNDLQAIPDAVLKPFSTECLYCEEI